MEDFVGAKFYCPHALASFVNSRQEGQHPLTGQRAANFRLLANQ